PALLLVVPDERREIVYPGDLVYRFLRVVEFQIIGQANPGRPKQLTDHILSTCDHHHEVAGLGPESLTLRLARLVRQELFEEASELIGLDLRNISSRPKPAFGRKALSKPLQLVRTFPRELLCSALGHQPAHSEAFREHLLNRGMRRLFLEVGQLDDLQTI